MILLCLGKKRAVRTNLWTWLAANAGNAGVVRLVDFSISGHCWTICTASKSFTRPGDGQRTENQLFARTRLPPGESYLFSVACKHTTKNRQQNMGLLLHHWILATTFESPLLRLGKGWPPIWSICAPFPLSVSAVANSLCIGSCCSGSLNGSNGKPFST